MLRVSCNATHYPSSSTETVPLLCGVWDSWEDKRMSGALPAATATYQAAANMSDTRAKTILKEAVDAVVNSFAKHTQSYGRGKW